MKKTFSIAVLSGFMALGLAGTSAAADISSVPCPGQGTDTQMQSGAQQNKGTGIVEGTLGDQNKQGLNKSDNLAKSDSTMKSDSTLNQSAMKDSDVRGSAESSARMGADVKAEPCVQPPSGNINK